MDVLIMAAWMSLAAGSSPVAGQPVRLVAERMGSAVRLSVVGDAASTVEARYELKVQSGAAAGNNNSVQRGVARLVPGETKNLLTLTLGNVAQGDWTATLSVDPQPGDAYQQVERSN